MIVVSNTSPLINLAAVGHLSLLQDLYGTIYTPMTTFFKWLEKQNKVDFGN